MNKTQSVKLDSFKLIVKESKVNPASIAMVPAFALAVDRIETICAEIDSHHIEHEKDLTGITADKDVALEALIDSSVEISGAAYSYAHDRHDNSLMSKVNYKPTSFAKMTQSEIVAVAGIILDEAMNIPADDLANEGVSTDEITAYKQLISQFKEIKSLKREAVIDRSGTTENLNSLFKEASTLIKEKLDRLAPQFKRKDPEFYRRYKLARGINKRNTKSPNAAPEPVQEVVVR